MRGGYYAPPNLEKRELCRTVLHHLHIFFVPYFVPRARFGGVRSVRYRAHGPFGPMGRGPFGPMGRRRALRAVRASRAIGPMGLSGREICRNPRTVKDMPERPRAFFAVSVDI